MPDTLRELLESGAAELGVKLGDESSLLVLKYLILLKKWNERINLTGTRDEREILQRHVIDSLAVVRHLPPRTFRVVDVGSGAGLPGAIVAIFRPDIDVTALEPIRKKSAFLSAVAREIPLRNFHARSERVAGHRERSDFEPYDVAMSRATWPVDEWLEIGSTMIHDDGLVIGMEGATGQALPGGATRHPYTLAGLRGDPGATRIRAIITSARLPP